MHLSYTEETTDCHSHSSLDEKFYKLCDILYEFQDIFATSLADLILT